MPRVEDAAEIRLDMRANQGGAVHELGDFLQAFADPHAIERGGNRVECAEHLVHGEAFLEGLVGFRIERFGTGHAARHPEQDAAVRLGRGMLDLILGTRLRQAGHGGGETGCRQRLEEGPAGELALGCIRGGGQMEGIVHQ